MRDTTPTDRDRALRRMRRATALSLAGAGALVAAFAGLAARALPGHHVVKTTVSRSRAAQAPAQATPPPLVPAQSSVTPTPPASAPVQSQAAPVVSSGGS
ncbi:MAG TPA: hypothetical protein VGN27_08010 [Gaiellaceae bacterium]|jgi:hypothetical protein|nr:hypothetical protein [Gaiellaceae bacterium]